jgi:hypothetical protein
MQNKRPKEDIFTGMMFTKISQILSTVLMLAIQREDGPKYRLIACMFVI